MTNDFGEQDLYYLLEKIRAKLFLAREKRVHPLKDDKIDLYETVFDVKYLKAALQLNQVMMRHFWDKDQGGLFFSADDAEALLLRRKEFYDGAIPSGNSIALLCLLRLMHLCGETEWEERAWDLASAFSAVAGGQPLGHAMLLCSLDYALGPASEITLVGSLQDAGIIEMLQAIRSRFLPNKSIVLVCGEEIREIAPFTKNLAQEEGKIAAYVCTDHVCSLPATSPEKMMKLLENTG